MSTGWTWDYIDDNMTIPRYLALAKYWKEWPPIHKLVAAYLGYKGKKEEASLDEFIAEAKNFMGTDSG